jgi:micrococcal nuclease
MRDRASDAPRPAEVDDRIVFTEELQRLCNARCVPTAGEASVRRVRRAAASLLLLTAVAALVLSAADERSPGGGPTRSAGRVVRVVDGDTIRVRTGDRVETVRYIGIDTPESVKPGTPVECFAHRAAAENERLVGGRRVVLERDAEARDRFGRLLAYVVREADGVDVNEALVRGGFAVPLTIAPNVRHAARLRAAAAAARREGLGLWRACQSG